MSCPIIGIVGHRHVVPRPFGDLPVVGTPAPYLDAVTQVGGRPVILPRRAGSELLEMVDGLVLTGGGDIDPARSGVLGNAVDVDVERDDDEIALVRAAVGARIPVLGICRGLQVMAVALGGGLQGGLANHVAPDSGHLVCTEPGSLVHRLLGEQLRTTALHHQAVAETGPCWRATAWADDGVIEAIESTDPEWSALGVQWHPELSWVPFFTEETGPALFQWLADAAGTYRRSPRGTRSRRPDLISGR